jgi:hypothetical protein
VGSCDTISPDGCWCDALCQFFGDCCRDKVAVCDSPPPPDPCAAAETAFCSAACAGAVPPELPLGCTASCACAFCGGNSGGNCRPTERCVDYKGDTCKIGGGGAVCLGVCVPAPTNSCDGRCGGKSADGTCFCDTLCTYYRDCCTDLATWCGGRTATAGECVRSSFDDCTTDADCRIGGCGSELCFNPAVSSGITTCGCGAPTAPIDGCGCVAGLCSWYQ